MNQKILFIHQGPHPVHGAFANSITKDWKRYGETHKEVLINVLKSFRENNDYDVIFSEGGLGLPYAFLKKLFKPNLKIILLNADNFFYILPKSSWIKQKMMKFLLSYVDSIIACSEINRKNASKYFDRNIFTVYPFGVNIHFENNVDLNSNNLLFIGSERPEKRYDLLVESVNLLKNANYNFELYLVGSCDSKINYESIWLHKEGFNQNISPYLEKCLIYIHPADYEAFGVVVLEAMGAGLIPIVSKNSGASEILANNGLNCLILENNDPKTMANKIIEIHKKPVSWKEKVSKKCRNICRDYSKKTQTKKFRDTFLEMINEN